MSVNLDTFKPHKVNRVKRESNIQTIAIVEPMPRRKFVGWEPEAKGKFLRGIRTYGLDYKAIAEFIGNKSEKKVRAYAAS